MCLPDNVRYLLGSWNYTPKPKLVLKKWLKTHLSVNTISSEVLRQKWDLHRISFNFKTAFVCEQWSKAALWSRRNFHFSCRSAARSHCRRRWSLSVCKIYACIVLTHFPSAAHYSADKIRHNIMALLMNALNTERINQYQILQLLVAISITS